jgi:hypothetical protein
MLDLLMVVPRKRCLFYLPALGELMSPTLDLDELGPSIGTRDSGLSGPDYDDFLAVLGAGRKLRRAEAGKAVRHSLMVERFDWS